MSLHQLHDTIAAISTPLGSSALAVVRISGDDALGIVAGVVSAPLKLLALRSGGSLYTSIQGSTAIIDDVIIHIHRSPHTFTGEDLVEITTHGSPVIAGDVLSLLISRGARAAEPGEFSRRAFLHGKIGLEEAELIAAKASASSEAMLRASELAIHEKYARLREAHELLIGLVAAIDAEIDFGESDQVVVDDLEHKRNAVVASLERMIDESINRRAAGAFFTVALTGPPNVGKSSLFNALLAHERSIVSDVPGTTRDFVESFIEISGFRVKLVDTAGVRETSEEIESRGIALGAQAARHADVVFYLTTPQDRTPKIPDVTLLHNKADLDGYSGPLAVSAVTGTGLAELHAWLESELHSLSSELSFASLTESEIARLRAVVERLCSLALESSEPALLADDLRHSGSLLAECLGVDIGEASLTHIFSKMCIGK